MNSGATTMRVYGALKGRILSGEFVSGDRLDPALLARDLVSSVTPVRDALHRLMGERIIESWEQAGFRMPLVTEAGLRELYGWSAELMTLVTRMAVAAAGSDPPSVRNPESIGSEAAEIFDRLAAVAHNHEVRAAVGSLNDRLALARRHETLLLNDASVIQALSASVAAQRWAEVRAGLLVYHRQRMRIVPALAQVLRPVESGTR
ncbi:MAG: GntR family transcriptional regulator [Sphingomonadales bacterium]|nr:GntR family transcriptional regulator [Sphingomonadales bacterium]